MVVSTLEENSLGRAFALSKVLEAARLDFEVVSCFASQIWEPLARDVFASKCLLVSRASLDKKILEADVVIALKPLEETLGYCLEVLGGNSGKLVVDIDDPDLELRLSWKRMDGRIARSLLRPKKLRKTLSMAEAVRSLPKIVSNPGLGAKYGGLVIPHVRTLDKLVSAEERLEQVAFVGTVRSHKGVSQLRSVVREINEGGNSLGLVVTAPAPRNPWPWEKWIGTTSFAEGQRILAQSKYAVITLWQEPYRSYQLPAKAVDALVHGIRIVYSPGAPLDWLVAEAGVRLGGREDDALRAGILEAIGLGPMNALEIGKAHQRLAPGTYEGGLSQLFRLL